MTPLGRARRRLLARAATLPFGLPWLSFTHAHAKQRRPAPKRFVVFFTANGTLPDLWWPTMENGRLALGPLCQPLARFADRLLFLQGLHLGNRGLGPGFPHQKGMGGLLTGTSLHDGNFASSQSRAGWARGISVDQRIVQALVPATPLLSLELGVMTELSLPGADVESRLVYADDARPLTPQNDPVRVYERLFSWTRGPQARKMRRERRARASVMDAVHRDLTLFAAELDSEDRQRIEAHADSVRRIEGQLRQLGAPPKGLRCQEPVSPAKAGLDPNAESAFPLLAETQIDLLASALACDMVRVASLQLSNGKNHLRYPWLDSPDDGHELSHAADNDEHARRQMTARYIFHAQLLERLLTRLDAIKEGEGSVLDNTVILWGSEVSLGNTHSMENMPFMLAGGGGLRTGRLLRYDGRPHNDLLLSILHLFGVHDRGFGDPKFVTGPLSDLTA